MSTRSRWVLYQWLADAGYFIHAIVPTFVSIDARVDDSVERILAQVPPDTTHFAFHLNCTLTGRFPGERAALVEALRRRPVHVLNADATDMSKRRVQALCAQLGLDTLAAARDGDPDELVIVKTNLNFGGDSEWALSAGERAALGIGEGSDIIWKPNDYRVLPRRDVEEHWWADDRLICERFVANADGRWYRAFLFLDRLAICELSNPHEIKKVGESRVLRVWMVSLNGRTPADAPSGLVGNLRRFVQAFSLDFGTVDLVIDDAGHHYIIDVNTTPAYNHPIEGVAAFARGGLG